jgi:hypothetical protein
MTPVRSLLSSAWHWCNFLQVCMEPTSVGTVLLACMTAPLLAVLSCHLLHTVLQYCELRWQLLLL